MVPVKSHCRKGGLRDCQKITWPSCISSSGRLWLQLNHKILDVALLRLRFCSIAAIKSDLKLSAILTLLYSDSPLRKHGRRPTPFTSFTERPGPLCWKLKRVGPMQSQERNSIVSPESITFIFFLAYALRLGLSKTAKCVKRRLDPFILLMPVGSGVVVCQRSVGEDSLPRYGAVAHGNCLVRTRMLGGVGRENLPFPD